MAKIKKTVLLYFPTPYPYNRSWHGLPIALLTLSRFIEKEGYDIKILTRHLSKNLIDEILENGKNSVCLAISAITGFQIYDGLKIAKIYKENFPNKPIIWGGWHPSILPTETVKNKYVDIVARGQGDITFTEIVHALDKGKSIAKIKGITYKKAGKILSNPDREPTDLSKVPPLPYHLIDVNKCFINTEYGKRTLPYISSYGCPHRCAFCVEQMVNKRQWRGVPAKIVVAEWENLVKKYGADSIAVYDTNFFVDENRVRDICQGLLDKGIHIKWGNAMGRAGHLSKFKESTWELMEKAGCAMILTGAESGSQNALDFISKDMNVNELVRFTELCHKYHIKIIYSFLVGLPWSKDPKENDKFVASEYKSTLGLIDRLLKISDRNRYTYYLFLPYPGAPLFDRAVKLGLKYPKSLEEWSTYLMSPEDAFNETVKQKWISQKDAQLTAMLTQYIFGLMDKDTYEVLLQRIKNPISKVLFKASYAAALSLVRLRWKLKFFGFRFDYWLFTIVYKYSGLI